MRRLLLLTALLLPLSALSACSSEPAGGDGVGAAAGASLGGPSRVAHRLAAEATLASAYRDARIESAIEGAYPAAPALVSALEAAEPGLRFAVDAGRYREGVISVRVAEAGRKLVLTTRAGKLLLRGSATEGPGGAPWYVHVSVID